MRRVVICLIAGSVLTLLPLAIQQLPSDTGAVGWLKWKVAILKVPGEYVGLIVAAGRIDDINRWVAGFANLAFYIVVGYVFLTIWRIARGATPPK